VWNWIKDPLTTQDDFGDPTGLPTGYALCIYDASGLVGRAEIDAFPNRWTALGTRGFRFRDHTGIDGGIKSMRLTARYAGDAKIHVYGNDVNLPNPPFPMTQPVTVQFINSSNAVCWETSFSGVQIRRNDTDRFRGKLP
jgi:hypothetical protein